MKTQPFAVLIRATAGVHEDDPVKPPPVLQPVAAAEPEKPAKPRDPNAKTPPEVVAAFNRYAPVGAEYESEKARFRAETAYDLNARRLYDGPEVAYNGMVFKYGGQAPRPIDSHLQFQYEFTRRQYIAAYRKYGDPTGDYPDLEAPAPLKPEPERQTEPVKLKHYPVMLAAVTSDGRAVSFTPWDTNGEPGTLLWVSDQKTAVISVQPGTPVTRGKTEVGKVDFFGIVSSNRQGQLLLQAEVTTPEKANQGECLLLWTVDRGLEMVAAAGDSITELTGWTVLAPQKGAWRGVLAEDGQVAVACDVLAPESSGKRPALLAWREGKLRLAALPLEDKLPPLAPVSRKARNAGAPVPMRHYQIGSTTNEVPAQEEFDFARAEWLATGKLAFRSTHGSRQGDTVWACEPATGSLQHFAGSERIATWFGDDTVAHLELFNGWPGWLHAGAPQAQQRVLNLGPHQATQARIQSRPASAVGLDPGQVLTGSDHYGHLTEVALGRGNLIAFTAFLEGDGPLKFDPAKGKEISAAKYQPNQWVLVAGESTPTPQFSILIAESTRTTKEATAAKRPYAGKVNQLRFSDDGTLIFTSDGIPPRLKYNSAAGVYLWSWNKSEGVRLLADGHQELPNSQAGKALGPFKTIFCSGGNVAIAPVRTNDCVYLAAE